MSQNNWPFIINVGNSIIGVTVLAMPFCFQACGIILGTLLLLFATWLTIVSCQLLMKAGVTARRRSYSLLAMFTHGALGKLIVEVGMIGLQLGTLIAQVVIIGDLGPAIVSKATGLQNSDNMRTALIVFLCLFIGLPLGLLKDVRTLSKTSSLCMAFYAFFTAYVVVLSLPNLVSGNWYYKVRFWRMEGFFQCLPIFSFAFGCQTQLFIVYDALSEPSLKRINSIVGSAVNVCTVSYLLVGFFGYVAFCNAGELSGDIINHFQQNNMCDVIKILFVFSIAVTIPLIVFPCRASLYTLCFPHMHKPRDDVPGAGKIPETHFKVITVVIIVGAMITGILIPNIEFVLGINGATMGTLICYIFPALFFLSVMSDKAEGLLSGKVVLALGMIIMVASTYTILATESTEVRVDTSDTGESNPVIDVAKLEDSKQMVENLRGDIANVNKSKVVENIANGQERREPPVPQEPVYDQVIPKDEIKDQALKKSDDILKDQLDRNKLAEEQPVQKDHDADNFIDKENDKPNAQIEKVVPDTAKDNNKLEEAEKKQKEIIEKLEQQQEQQEKMLQEQKKILEELKEHKDSHKKDESAVEQNKNPVADRVEQKLQPIVNQVLQFEEDRNREVKKKSNVAAVPQQGNIQVQNNYQGNVFQKEVNEQLLKDNKQIDIQFEQGNKQNDQQFMKEPVNEIDALGNNEQPKIPAPQAGAVQQDLQKNMQKLDDVRLPQLDKKSDTKLELLQDQKVLVPVAQQEDKQNNVINQADENMQKPLAGNFIQSVNDGNNNFGNNQQQNANLDLVKEPNVGNKNGVNNQQQNANLDLVKEPNNRQKRDLDSGVNIGIMKPTVPGKTVQVDNGTHLTDNNAAIPDEGKEKDVDGGDKMSKDLNENQRKNTGTQRELKGIAKRHRKHR